MCSAIGLTLSQHPLSNVVQNKKSLYMFVVELESKVWLAPWEGDPGRTCLLKNAQLYKTAHGAKIAMGIARRYRKFKGAVVIPFKSIKKGNYESA